LEGGNVSECICKAGYKMSCPVHGLKEERMKLFSEGQIVIDIFDESKTEWIVWEQKGKFVLVYIPIGAICIKPADHLYVVKMD
jgi:hypothetical protein